MGHDRLLDFRPPRTTDGPVNAHMLVGTEQQHEACWRTAKFMTPTVLAQTLIAGNADTATLWFFMLGPLVIFWAIGGIILATVRRIWRVS